MKFQTLYQHLRDWAEQAVAGGWLDEQQLKKLSSIEQVQAEDLFGQQTVRPLIVGFFGGTGVGKSSLLNRLAGESIARVGVERPTSQEVTFYLHEDFRLESLPDDLPVEPTRIAYHSNADRRLVAWLDMPDFDSTEQAHRELVLTWLPYVDWLIYVVSPDRYHDDVGWRFLQTRGKHHAWLFVMNHWDQGTEEQLQDFRRRLIAEGFENPTILRTSCSGKGVEDDFEGLERSINDAIQRYGMALLQQLGVQARVDELSAQAAGFETAIGTDAHWQQTEKAWNDQLDASLQHIGNQWSLNLAALAQTRLLVKPSGMPWPWKKGLSGDESLPDSDELVNAIWTKRSEDSLKDMNIALLNRMQAEGLPTTPADALLERSLSEFEPAARSVLREQLVAALATPGNRLQRFFYKLTATASWLLPLLAALWAVVHVVRTFYLGTRGEAEFLGIDFAVHSGLLIALAWFLPWLLHHKLKPSMVAAARRGLEKGIGTACEAIAQRYVQMWHSLKANRDSQVAGLLEVRRGLEQTESVLGSGPDGFHALVPESRKLTG